MDLADRFVAQCSPVIGLNNPTAGTITKLSVAHLKASDLDTLFRPGGLWADLDAWLRHQVEMQACGVKRDGFMEMILATTDQKSWRSAVGQTPTKGGPSLLHPFIIGTQKSVVNDLDWYVVTGVAVGGYTPATLDQAIADASKGPLTQAQLDLGGTRVVRLSNNYGLPMDAAVFRPKQVLHIFYKTNDGTSTDSAWQIVATAVDTALTYIDVLVASQNAASVSETDLTPTKGVVVAGINNVNDYETWCYNKATTDPRKRVLFWMQTRRWGRNVDSTYEEVFARLMVSNAAFAEFGDLPLVEQNAQDELAEEHAFCVAFLFNKKLANQTKELWESLTNISTAAGTVLSIEPSKVVAKRANFEGVKEQLAECGQVKDGKGQPLNLEEWLQGNYDIMRARETAGRKVTNIDWWTSTEMRGYIQTAFLGKDGYYQTMYGGALRINEPLGQLNDDLGIVWDTYMSKRTGAVKINVMTTRFFDDWLLSFQNAGVPEQGNLLLCLDLGQKPNGSIYYALLDNQRVVYQTATIEELARLDPTYMCRMKILSKKQTLNSETGTVIVECPLNSMWTGGWALATPILTGLSSPYTDLQ